MARERPIGIFGVTLGEYAPINVTIEANPRPILEWTVNGETVPEGSVDSTQRFEVTSAQPLVSHSSYCFNYFPSPKYLTLNYTIHHE